MQTVESQQGSKTSRQKNKKYIKKVYWIFFSDSYILDISSCLTFGAKIKK